MRRASRESGGCAPGRRWSSAGTFVAFLALFAISSVCLSQDVALIEEDHEIDAEPEIDDGLELFRTGEYTEAENLSSDAIDGGDLGVEWFLLKIRAQLATGRFHPALETLRAGLDYHTYSIRLRWLGIDVLRSNDRSEEADAMKAELERLARQAPWRYRGAEDRIIIGRFLLGEGADAREVLEGVYDRIKMSRPTFVDSYIASGDLALEKFDFGIAKQEFRQAFEMLDDDPDLMLRLTRSLVSSDPEAAQKHLEAALERNPYHVDSLLFLIDSAIDRENYGTALEKIGEVLAVHPTESRAHAYRAVLAHLDGDLEGETKARAQALASWSKNSDIDHLIGRKLSQKYRFAEGAAYQRRALAVKPTHRAAKLQLSQDLLRLGKEEEGWKLADEVYDEDGYSVLAHNLSVLQEEIAGYRALEADGIVLRMDPREATIYGDRALELVREAKRVLCEKYEIELTEPVLVEIFPEQKDFAIRTFGLPGGAGFLGVCFGNVITANSPASQGESPANWEAVLWHEFCHVNTLNKTKNRMPRWLSEGISVYEEIQRNSIWGDSMSPQYLAMIEAEGVPAVSQLSGSFLRPQSALHLQFAYYQSSLVVEFIIERHGFEALLAILESLGAGVGINAALEKHLGSLEAVDRDAEVFVRARAAKFAEQADWSQVELEEDQDPAEALAKWLEEHPRSYWGLMARAAQLQKEEKVDEAIAILERCASLAPAYTNPGNAYEALAAIHRSREDLGAERAVLERHASRDADALTSYLRLCELAENDEDWGAVARNAERLFAVHPLLKAPHRSYCVAMEKLDREPEALGSFRARLALDPVDPAELHYRVGHILRQRGELVQAKRHILQALEEAPRFREAHRELLAVLRMSEEKDPKEEKRAK